MLTASTTNHIEATRVGVASKNTVGFTGGSIPLYTVLTGASSVMSYTDNRAWVAPAYLPGNGSVTVTAADVDLTPPANADKARCSYLNDRGTERQSERHRVEQLVGGRFLQQQRGVYHDGQDICELLSLLDSFNEAKKTARLTIVRMLVTGLVLVLLAGAFVKMKLFRGGQ